MLAAAPVVVAPVAPLLAIGLAALLAWVFLYGCKQGYDYSLGALLRQLARLVADLPLIGGFSAKRLLAVDHFLLDQLGQGIEQLETVIGKFWHALAWVVDETASTLSGFAHDVETTIGNLVTVTIPATAGAIAKPIAQDIGQFRRALRATVNEELRRFARGIDALGRDLTREKLAREHGIDALAGTLRSRLDALADSLRGDIAAVNRYAHGALSRRLGRLERLLAEGVIGGVALYALTRAFPYWQCTNVRALNKAVCRAPVGALDDLLGLALVVVGSLSIRDLAHELQAITEPVAGAVNDWIVEK